MWITFLPFEDTKMLSPISSFFLAEDDITSEGFIHFGKLLSFPGSLSCISDTESKLDTEGPFWVQTPVHPLFLIYRKRFSLLGLPWVPKSGHSQSLIWEVKQCRNKGKAVKEERQWQSVQFSSVAQSCPTLCDPMNRSTPVLPVHHQLPELTQTHIRQVGDAIQPSYPLLSPSPSAPNPSQHQGKTGKP